jgi:hypothetical protein
MKRHCRRDAQQCDQPPRKRFVNNCMEKVLTSAENLAEWNKFSACCGVRSFTVAFIRISYWSPSSILSFTSCIFKVAFKIILPFMPRSLKFTLSCWQTFLVSAIRVTCSACPVFYFSCAFCFIVHITFREDQNVWTALLCNFPNQFLST